MISENQLRDLIGSIIGLEVDNIQPETSLSSLDNSLGEAKLRLGLKRLGVQLPTGSRPMTFGHLNKLLSGTPACASSAPIAKPRVSVPLAAPLADLQVGLDVQEISQLPLSSDYWEDVFYRGIFDKSEIGYAVIHPEPRTHFAGFWCAKEALRKCDSAFVGIDPSMTMVAHDDYGRPYFLWKNSAKDIRLPHALSISHTSSVAMAIVVALPDDDHNRRIRAGAR